MRNLTITFEHGRIRTCRFPRFSALQIDRRASASTFIRTMFTPCQPTHTYITTYYIAICNSTYMSNSISCIDNYSILMLNIIITCARTLNLYTQCGNSNGKNATRHLIQGLPGSEFLAICNHCGVMTAWSRKTWKFCKHFLRFGGKNDPLW